jgi:hypothetical protein
MAISGIPEVVNDFNVYSSGNKIVGLTGEVSIPDFEAMTETISGAGILGEYDATIPGRFGAMEQEIPFRTINTDYFNLITPTSPVELTLRGAIQQTNTSTGATDYVGMREVVRGKAKKVTPGTVKAGGTMDSSVTIEITYILLELDGSPKVELDKLNGVYKVNGVDVLSRIKSLT